MAMEPFGARLRDSMGRRGPLCAGIDPHPALLKAWGLSDDPAGLLRFTMTCVEAFSAELAVLKPQSAFFERHGAAGIGVLEQAVRAARAEGALVLLDAKRGDMEYTMRGYADAYLDQSSPLAVDAMTVSPFLGFGSLAPVMRTAQQHGAGVFVLALTSNPEAAQVQHARAGTGTVSGEMLAAIRSSNDGVLPMGSVGAVVGANLAELHEDLAINGPLLAPGLGAQGGTPDDILRIFAGVTDFVLPSSSRGLLQHGPQVGALREAAARTNDELVKALAS
ncbi:MAG: orotidine-5'-phosphate decarboxylase [Nocardioidaceae bacterium]|nr:orotidine-5'-phosphate decarboxylase [Nocardioidaceae bacterium]